MPATPGAECVGRVTAVGAGVALHEGDLVINMQRENWAQRRRIAAADAIPIPSGLDIAQAAMLRINPATAQLLLEDHVALGPGDWVIQNAANSTFEEFSYGDGAAVQLTGQVATVIDEVSPTATVGVTSVPLGAVVHDSATVSGTATSGGNIPQYPQTGEANRRRIS